MKSIITFGILLLHCIAVLAQGQYQNMQFYSNWNDSGLPVRPGFNLRYNDLWGYEADGRFYVMMGSLSYAHFFDVTDPEDPVEVTRVEGINQRNNTLNNSVWRDFKTFGSYAYMTADEGNEGLTVFDLSNLPDTVTKVLNDTLHFLRAHNLYIDVPNARMYIAGSGNNLIVYSLSNPASPAHLATVDLRAVSGLGNSYVHDVFVRNNIAYCSHGYNGYCAYNFTNPSSPTKLACINLTSGYNHSSWLTDNNQFLVYAEELPQGKPLVIFHRDSFVADQLEYWKLFKEPLLAPNHLNVTPHNPFISGDYLYVSYYEDGVVVFDISDPYNPYRIAYYDTYPSNNNYNGTQGCWGVYPFFSNGLIAASDTENGLFLMELELQPLAVDFTSFDMRCTESKTTISWATAQSRADLVFTLQGSYNGRTFVDILHFSPEEQRSGSFSTTTAQPYPYLRLRSEDVFGRTTFSQIISSCLQQNAISVFPNPTQGDENLHISYPISAEPVQLRVLDMLGKVVYISPNWEGGDMVLPTQAFSSGIYLLEMISSDGFQLALKKWVKK
jgi:choice-of-anchor B domain-containing protein